MKRMTEFSFSLADSLLKLFCIIFPIGAISEKTAHPEEETEPKEIVHPEKESAPEEVTHPKKEVVPAEIDKSEKETISDETVHPEKETLSNAVILTEEESEYEEKASLEEPTSEEMRHPEKEYIAEEINQWDKETASGEYALSEQEPLFKEMDDSEKEAISQEMAQSQEEAASTTVSETEQKTVSRSLVKQQNVFTEEYRTTELATGLIGSILGALSILLAFVIGVVGVTFKFDGTTFGEVMRVVTPIFAIVAMIGVILQGKYPKLGGCLVIVAVVQGFVAVSFLYVPSGILLLISSYLGLQRSHQIQRI